MRKIAIFCALVLGIYGAANAATAVNPRGQSASSATDTASTTGTRTGTAAARSATTARSATGTRSSTTTSTTARSATAGRTTVSRTPTATSATSTAASAARSATVAARAGATQKVIGTGTTVAAANQNVVVSEACRQKYYGCMDSFCMLDNDSGGRCICSDKNAEYDDILAQIEALDLQSYQMATYGVERIEMGEAADVAIANANAVAQSIMDDTSKEKEKKSLDLTSWLSPVDFSSEDVFADTGMLQNPIEGKEGDALYQASNQICVQQMPECASELSMLQLMYAQQIRSDCTAYENSLKQQKNASAQKLYAAEQALREAALDQYQSANKYDLGQCTVEFKNCMISTGGCGEDFSGCASIATFDSTSTRGNKKASTYEIQGTVTSIEIQASTYDILLSKKPLCESVTKQCQLVADQVWDTFLKEVAPQIKSAELIAENNTRQNCIGNISSCFQQACKDTMDPNDPDGSYDLCLTRPETMLNLCQVPLNACGISTASAEDAQESDIWDFVVARLAAMRVDSCTQSVKQLLQSEDRCGSDYTQCIGLDLEAIQDLIPQESLVACQENGQQKSMEDINNIIQGILLNLDNSLMTACQDAVINKMTEVCGDASGCEAAFSEDKEFGTDGMAINMDQADELHIIGLLDFGALGNSLSSSAMDVSGEKATMLDVVNGWTPESYSPENASKYLSASRLNAQNIVNKIRAVVNMVANDEQVKTCTQGRDMSQIRGTSRNVVNRTEARYPNLLDSYIQVIVDSGLSVAKANYDTEKTQLLKEATAKISEIAEEAGDISGGGMCYDKSIYGELDIMKQ